MQNREKLVRKLALVFVSLIVLELILIGYQVQSVKAIKKKMLLKKIKKFLPLWALVKPKKKIILLPIPIPMYQQQQGFDQKPAYTSTANRPTSSTGRPKPAQLSVAGSNPSAPMSFIMMSSPDFASQDLISMPMLDAALQSAPYLPASGLAQELSLLSQRDRQKQSGAYSSGSPAAMLMPTMTMTIQSEPGGGSAIELSTNMAPASGEANHTVQPAQVAHSSGPLGAADGEHYYSSPWTSAAAPLASPMKIYKSQFKSGKLAALGAGAGARPSPSRPQTGKAEQGAGPMEQSSLTLQQQLELDNLVAVGPAQMRPFYQDFSGRLHMAVERPAGETKAAPGGGGERDESPAEEIQTVGLREPRAKVTGPSQAAGVLHAANPSLVPVKQSGRLQSSPAAAAKGRLQKNNY